MEFLPLAIPDVVLIKHRHYVDERGSFMELFRQQEFTTRCSDLNFVQDNLSRSRQWHATWPALSGGEATGQAGAGYLWNHLRRGG